MEPMDVTREIFKFTGKGIDGVPEKKVTYTNMTLLPRGTQRSKRVLI
jgi:hypothetical protein